MTAKEMEKRMIAELQNVVDEIKDAQYLEQCNELYWKYGVMAAFIKRVTGKEVVTHKWKVTFEEEN